MNRSLMPVIVAVFVAGCLEGSGPTDVPTPRLNTYEDLPWDALGALLYSEDHDHFDRDVHMEVRRGVDVLTQGTLSNDGKSVGEYSEADAARGLVAVAIVTGPNSNLRIVLLDQAALPELKIVGYFDEPMAYGDIKLDRAVPRIYVPYPLPTVPDGKAFSIWDVTRPDAPRRLGDVAGIGCHMLHPMRIGSTSYVWCAAINGAQVYQVVDLPNGEATAIPLLPAEPVGDVEVARYADYYAYLGAPRPWLMRVHDMTFQEDPLSKNPILVTAHELQGIRVFDTSRPEVPRQLGYWQGEGLGKPIDRIHTVGLAKIGDRRIGFAATETFNNLPPALYVVDFTDYANPKFLAEWNPPGIKTDQRLTYALHNFQVVGDRLYIANLHAGLWVLDVAEPSQPTPVALSTPVWDTEYPRPGQTSLPGFRMDQNMYWDVILVDGYAIATDMSTGVEVLHFDRDPLGQADYDSKF